MKKLLILLIAPMIAFTSCSEDENTAGQQSQKPVTPPTSSMAPDLDSFSDDDNSGSREAIIGNWGYAAINVGVYSAILYNHLIVPVKGFQLTIGQEAYFDSETNLWVWEKSFDIATKGSYDIKLTADVDGNDVDWKGYISKDSGFDDFVWFEGESKLNGEAGSWVLYESPENPEVWITSSWVKDENAGTAKTTFTVEKEGDHLGSYIAYEMDANADLNRNVVISDANTTNMIYVDWNHSENYGRVKSESHFQNNVYHCWDKQYQDTDCE